MWYELSTDFVKAIEDVIFIISKSLLPQWFKFSRCKTIIHIFFFIYLKPDIPKKPQPNTTPAMNVNTSAGGMGMVDKDYISYTVSAPSGRGTAMLSVDGKWHPSLPAFWFFFYGSLW